LGTPAPSEREGEQTAGIPSAAGDQLVENGLASPLCRGASAGSLSAAAQRNCRTSGFLAAPAPTNDYAIDVHIDTGTFGVSKGGLLSVVQDIFVTPVWGALEWLVHALVVMLEWCYTLELLDGSTTSTVASALGRARAGFTDPWLVLVLALASVLAVYNGLVRRRVADTLGGALSMLVMMAGGLWVIASPSGTVGVVGRWADQASLGTLAATVSGTPASASATLGDGMRSLYRASIETPWCYMEFGNVGWCADPSRLEGRLRAAALALVSHGSAHGAASAQAAELVRSAGTNGALFLAFPANGPARNSINDEGSLLRAICQSEEATKCRGPAASEAQFRTDGGTFPRVLGLLAIAVGVLGMALLFGALALRLLAAAFLALFLLLLAPFAVLAPALGDGGRAVFAGWATRLLGAVVSKLLFSFVLGALLSMQRILVSLAVLGWWTQWLLLSAFWWTVFLKRHQAAAILQSAGRAGVGGRERGGGGAQSAGGGGRGGDPAGGGRRQLAGRVERSLQTYGAVRHPRRWAHAQVNRRIAQATPPTEERPHSRRWRKAFPFKGRGRVRGGVAGLAERAEGGLAGGRMADGELAGGGMAESGLAESGLAESGLAEGGLAESGLAESGLAESGLAGGGLAEGETSGAAADEPELAPALVVTAAAHRLVPKRSDRRRSAPGRPETAPGAVAQGGAAPGGVASEATAPEAAAPGAPAGGGGDVLMRLLEQRPRGDVRSPVMEDAFAVSQRRKRQLGFEPEDAPKDGPEQ
jgi:hypothetical protein